MFDHIGFLVRDSGISLPFFTACLRPLGIERVQDRPQFNSAIFMIPDQRGFLFTPGRARACRAAGAGDEPDRAPLHLAFAAPSEGAVDALHKVALDNEETDNGAPGFRPQGRRVNANYNAFVLDPDRTNVEASWPNPQATG
jgi:catechol 2,3-dioxygenase-like lactoylglutathione lyase family enzyme